MGTSTSASTSTSTTSTSTSTSTPTTSTSISASTTSTTTTGGGGATTSADFSDCEVFCKDQADGNYGECCGPKFCTCYNNGNGFDIPCGEGQGFCPSEGDGKCVADCDENICCK